MELHSNTSITGYLILIPKQYAAIGVAEYWLIDPERAWVMVGTLIRGSYQYETFQGDESIDSPSFPGFNLTAEQVLQTG